MSTNETLERLMAENLAELMADRKKAAETAKPLKSLEEALATRLTDKVMIKGHKGHLKLYRDKEGRPYVRMGRRASQRRAYLSGFSVLTQWTSSADGTQMYCIEYAAD